MTRPCWSTANADNPRSRPSSMSSPCSSTAGGNVSSPTSTTNDAKYRPSAVLITVTDDGADGRFRDHATRTSPIFASASFFPLRALNAPRVKRIVCRLSLRDLNLGAPMRRPARLPLRLSKKLRYAVSQSRTACCSICAGASDNHARSSVRLASVISRFCNTVLAGYLSPAAYASRRARTASLNTTRAHPNARASACR
ncbi:hypothetical protein PIS_089 [Saccharomonospora phage PIS 136]|nr:hypothetical protein PIS_089 [Saccharomonospora phage PIS 136]